MRCIKFTALLILVMLFIKISGQTSGFFNNQAILKSKTNGTFAYRVPAIITTQSGNIIVFAEARNGRGGDWDPSSIISRKSSDSGNTWSEEKIIVKQSGTQCSYPVPVVDLYSGKIHLLYLTEHSKIFYTYSTDECENWNEPLNITSIFNEFYNIYPWTVIGIGPGHGTQLSNGRIIIPIWLSESTAKDTITNIINSYPTVTGVLYSDNFGLDWAIGDLVCRTSETYMYPNEASCVELKNGNVLFNIRNESLNYRRLISTSPNGVTDWSPAYYSDSFFDPVCHASMIRLSVQPYQSKDRILFCNPDSRNVQWADKRGTVKNSAPKRQRSNLTIRLSYDEAKTFPIFKELDSGYSGYSDLAISNDGVIYCLYESGMMKNLKFIPEQINLCSFNLQWLTNNTDSLTNYDMPINSNIICAKNKIEPNNKGKKGRKNNRKLRYC